MNQQNKYNFHFVNGAIPAQRISEAVMQSSNNHSIGAYSVFLGQVRADLIDDKKVVAIDYTANSEMATDIMLTIFNEAESEFEILSATVIHSLGNVLSGEICLLVLVSCGHRKESFKAIEYIVERIKKELPVWGKELLEDQSHYWKVNK